MKDSKTLLQRVRDLMGRLYERDVAEETGKLTAKEFNAASSAWFNLHCSAELADALIYDMLSMLTDLYNNWPWEQLEATLEEVTERAEKLGITLEEDD